MSDTSFITSRISALYRATPAELFTKAADILKDEPFLAQGSFLRVWLPGDGVPYWVEGSTSDEITKPVACHCLEGALQEAAGVYDLSWDRSILTSHCEPESIGPVEVFFDLHVRDKLAKILVQVLPMDKLIEDCTYTTIGEVLRNATAAVYRYSDYVLAPMGRAGIEQAVVHLRDAADLAKLTDAKSA